mgnify:CR=1 FL=1
MSNITLTRTQACTLDRVLRNCFDMRALADMGQKIALGKFDATMQEVFDLASLCRQRHGLNLTEHPRRMRVAVAMFHCIAATALSTEDCDAIIACDLIQAVRDAA